MKIRYEFADGTVSEVEVEESIGAVIIEDRRLEDNLDRKERYLVLCQVLVQIKSGKILFYSAILVEANSSLLFL